MNQILCKLPTSTQAALEGLRGSYYTKKKRDLSKVPAEPLVNYFKLTNKKGEEWRFKGTRAVAVRKELFKRIKKSPKFKKKHADLVKLLEEIVAAESLMTHTPHSHCRCHHKCSSKHVSK